MGCGYCHTYENTLVEKGQDLEIIERLGFLNAVYPWQHQKKLIFKE